MFLSVIPAKSLRLTKYISRYKFTWRPSTEGWPAWSGVKQEAELSFLLGQPLLQVYDLANIFNQSAQRSKGPTDLGHNIQGVPRKMTVGE